MERSVSIDAILQSDNLSIPKTHETKNNNLSAPKNRQDFNKKDISVDDNGIEVASSNCNVNEDFQAEIVENQSNEENQINKSHTSRSININEIKDSWKNFIDKLHKKKPSVASVLDNSVPMNFENDKITIQVASVLEFHLNMIEKNYDLVKSTLFDEFKIELDFTISQKSESRIDEHQTQSGAEDAGMEGNDQLRDKIVDLFDGEILT